MALRPPRTGPLLPSLGGGTSRKAPAPTVPRLGPRQRPRARRSPRVCPRPLSQGLYGDEKRPRKEVGGPPDPPPGPYPKRGVNPSPTSRPSRPPSFFPFASCVDKKAAAGGRGYLPPLGLKKSALRSHTTCPPCSFPPSPGGLGCLRAFGAHVQHLRFSCPFVCGFDPSFGDTFLTHPHRQSRQFFPLGLSACIALQFAFRYAWSELF